MGWKKVYLIQTQFLYTIPKFLDNCGLLWLQFSLSCKTIKKWRATKKPHSSSGRTLGIWDWCSQQGKPKMSRSGHFILASRCPDGQKSKGRKSKGLKCQKSKGQKSEGQKSEVVMGWALKDPALKVELEPSLSPGPSNKFEPEPWWASTFYFKKTRIF